MSQEQTLEPCAFCGKSHTPKIVLASEHWADEYDGYYPHSDSYAVMCDASSPNGPGGCGASGGFKATEADAIAAWNRRAALSATQPAQAAQPVGDAFTKAIEIRTAQGWKLTGEAIPVLYTDTINDQQVMRDDVWLCTTAALKPAQAAQEQATADHGGEA